MSVYRGPIQSGARLLPLVPVFIASDAELRTAFPDWRRLTGRTHRKSGVNPFTKERMVLDVPEWEAVPEGFETHVDVYFFEQLPQVRFSSLYPTDLEELYAFLHSDGNVPGKADATQGEALISEVLCASSPHDVGEQLIFLVPTNFVEAVAGLYLDQVEEMAERWTWAQRVKRPRIAPGPKGLISRWFGRDEPPEVPEAPPVAPEVVKPK